MYTIELKRKLIAYGKEHNLQGLEKSCEPADTRDKLAYLTFRHCKNHPLLKKYWICKGGKKLRDEDNYSAECRGVCGLWTDQWQKVNSVCFD